MKVLKDELKHPFYKRPCFISQLIITFSLNGITSMISEIKLQPLLFHCLKALQAIEEIVDIFCSHYLMRGTYVY